MRKEMCFMRKRIFALAVPVVLVVLGAIYLFSSGHSEIQTYTDQDHGFCVDLMKDQFMIETTSDDEGAEISFLDKNIQSNYPEWTGTVFTIFVYDRDVVEENPFDVLDGPTYLGESDRFYYGIYFPTDVNYPPEESEAAEHYEELSEFARDRAAQSFSILP